jgi:hypothetical protein
VNPREAPVAEIRDPMRKIHNLRPVRQVALLLVEDKLEIVAFDRGNNSIRANTGRHREK